jgi:hypothetical protein
MIFQQQTMESNVSKPVQLVKIQNGTYRGGVIENGTYKLIRVKGDVLHIFNDGTLGTDSERVSVKSNSYEIVKQTHQPSKTIQLSTEPVVLETDEQVMNRHAETFNVLTRLTRACIRGNVPSLIVEGPPGVGKSYGVINELERDSLTDVLASRPLRYNVVKGQITAIGLYCTLYRYSDPRNIIVFDDCDSVFKDDLMLNILKSALDSGRRTISWLSNSSMLRDTSTPDRFEFKGGVIFITNGGMDSRSRERVEHIKALRSRSLYLNLKIDTPRDQMLRIRQVHRDADGGLFAKYEFDAGIDETILNYMWDHRERLDQISLRTAMNIANLVKDSPEDWQFLAERTVMKY